MLDFPSNSPSFSLDTSAALDDTVGRKVVVGSFAMGAPHPGAADLPRFTYAVNDLTLSGNNFLYVESEDAQIDAVEGSIRPQATGRRLFVLLAGPGDRDRFGQTLSCQEHRRARYSIRRSRHLVFVRTSSSNGVRPALRRPSGWPAWPACWALRRRGPRR